VFNIPVVVYFNTNKPFERKKCVKTENFCSKMHIVQKKMLTLHP